MAEKRFIRQLSTSNFDFPSLITDPERKYIDKTFPKRLMFRESLKSSFSPPQRSRPRSRLSSSSTNTTSPWLDGAPPVFYVGVNYDPATRGIDDPLVEKA